MLDEELWPDLGEEVGGSEACHDAVGLAGRARLVLLLLLLLLLRAEDRLHQTVNNLLAGLHQLLRGLPVDLE